MAHLSMEVDGVDEVAAALAERYRVAVGAAGPRPGLRLVQDTVAGVEVSRIRYGVDAVITAQEPRAGTCVARLRGGSVGYRSAGQQHRWAAGDVYLAAPAGAVFEAEVHDCEADYVVIDPSTFAAVAQTADGGAPALTGWTPVSGAAARQWLDTLEFVQRTAAGPAVPPLVAGATARLMAAATLAAFPTDAAVEPAARDRRDARPRIVAQAVAFIESHPDRDLTVADVAEAAHVTPRALQLAFRKHLGTTPMAHLRRVRLERAHADLLAADPGRATVGAIAARWGFADAGRFARRYRDVYGRSPSTTLLS
ncbi:AraC family transcriptional regulator [Klenkia taihuensis]|uniref:AraC-type DNA-binding protein n=1 Tax=Klenkia taihuensis TaxID=1225127 RepID=A0A1I1IBX6_9ACTN|nr:AraC family transcriptional regulator [Klenkia taihuensis]SFC33521.1 AraC-type DNA-binding protein [Klenkia taihuensis]